MLALADSYEQRATVPSLIPVMIFENRALSPHIEVIPPK